MIRETEGCSSKLFVVQMFILMKFSQDDPNPHASYIYFWVSFLSTLLPGVEKVVQVNQTESVH